MFAVTNIQMTIYDNFVTHAKADKVWEINERILTHIVYNITLFPNVCVDADENQPQIIYFIL